MNIWKFQNKMGLIYRPWRYVVFQYFWRVIFEHSIVLALKITPIPQSRKSKPVYRRTSYSVDRSDKHFIDLIKITNWFIWIMFICYEALSLSKRKLQKMSDNIFSYAKCVSLIQHPRARIWIIFDSGTGFEISTFFLAK